MAKTKSIKREYFKLDNDQVIYPASVSRRFIARFLDFFMAIIISSLITAIYIGVAFDAGDTSLLFSETIYNQYNAVMMSAWTLRILLVVALCVLIPIFNKKNPGQSIGKKMMGITPIFLSKRSDWISITIRELPVTLVFILPTIFTLILGYDASYVHSSYIAYARNADSVDQMGTYSFIVNYWAIGGNANTLVDPAVQLQTWEVVIACFEQTLIYLFFLVFIVLWISMMVESQKRGSHDKLAKTAVVDLKTITSLKEAEDRYNMLIGNITSQAGSYQSNPIDLQNPQWNDSNQNSGQQQPPEFEKDPQDQKPLEPGDYSEVENQPSEDLDLQDVDKSPEKTDDSENN